MSVKSCMAPFLTVDPLSIRRPMTIGRRTPQKVSPEHILLQLSMIDRDLFAVWLAKERKPPYRLRRFLIAKRDSLEFWASDDSPSPKGSLTLQTFGAPLHCSKTEVKINRESPLRPFCAPSNGMCPNIAAISTLPPSQHCHHLI
uniref:Uncharacterized protein n=1 Tax=Romanomermis culicivorax TaxID=13658 RepID=A0A915J7A0_ROMCU